MKSKHSDSDLKALMENETKAEVENLEGEGRREVAGTDCGNRLPTIIVNERPLRDVSKDAINALVKHNDPPTIFARNRNLYRVLKDEEGRAYVERLTKDVLLNMLAQVANFRRDTGEDCVDVAPPQSVIKFILAEGSYGGLFSPLDGIAEFPVLRPDGTILHEEGYDRATRLYYSPAVGLDGFRVSENPSDSELKDAVEVLEEALCDFPFVDEASRANAYALLLTPLVLPAIDGLAPLAVVESPQKGTGGKGLLVSTMTQIVTGRMPNSMIAPRTEAEFRKQITAAYESGNHIVVYDNVDHTLKHASLAAALTSAEWCDRILGKSEVRSYPNRTTWIATGNNIKIGGDIARRAYQIRLDPKMSHPWKRDGFRHPMLVQWVKDNRLVLLTAALTIVRAWYSAGKPKADTPIIGSFEPWVETVGGMLANAGIEGFLGNLEGLYSDADEEAEQWESFYREWWEAFGDKPLSTKEIADGNLALSLPEELALASEQGRSLTRALGKALSKREGTRFGPEGFHVEKAGKRHNSITWKMARNEKPEL